jgi:RNA polymerase sigma-70 factor (ECF subfamily)
MTLKTDHSERIQAHNRMQDISPETVAPATSVGMERTVEVELALIESVRAGETQLFYELISPYERSVYIAAASVLRNEADAEEAAQEALLRAFANLGSFRMEAKFSTWLIQIAVNTARSKRRKDRKALYESTEERDGEEEGDYRPRDFADWRETPVEALQRGELRCA